MEKLRLIGTVAVAAAWLTLAGVALLLLYNSRVLFDMFTGQAFAARFSTRDLSPREILKKSSESALFCYSDEWVDRKEGPQLTRANYDPVYNNLVYRKNLHLYRMKNGIVQSSVDENGGVGKCLRKHLAAKLLLHEMNVDPEVLWIYLLFRKGNDELLAIWPAVSVERGFRAKDRPWYPERLAQAKSQSISYKGGEILQTRPYSDVFTGESVISMLYKTDQSGRGITVYTGLDVRVDPFPSTFHLVIFLNFVALLIFSVINALAAKQLEMEFSHSWHWAWLCWALLYSVYALVYLLRVSLPIINLVRFDLLKIVPILSIANNAFFALAALQMLGAWDRKKRFLACSAGAIVAAFLFFLAAYLETIGLLVVGGSRGVDAVSSVLVTMLLAWAFIKQIRPKGQAISGPEPFSVPVAQWLVGFFFFIFAVHQLEIARTTSNPVVDQVFWMFSLLMKIGLAALYYIIILKLRYREEGEVGAIVFERMEQGVIAIDSNFTILAINGSAAKLVGVERGAVLGKDVREVAFRSLFETEKMFLDLTDLGSMASRDMLMKQYSGGYPGRFRDVVRSVGAQIVKDSEIDRIFALLYLRAYQGLAGME